MVRRRSSFVPIFVCNSQLGKDAIGVHCWGYRGITERVDTLVQAWYWIRFPKGYCILLAVVSTQSECSVLLRCEHLECSPFCLGRFKNIHPQHLVDLLFLEFPCKSVESCTQRHLMIWKLHKIKMKLGVGLYMTMNEGIRWSSPNWRTLDFPGGAEPNRAPEALIGLIV